MWLIALILFWGVLLLLVAALQRSRGEAQVASGTCPDCKVPLQALLPDASVQPPRRWEVLACPSCDLVAPVVQGSPGHVGWCPACRQRSLELTATRLPETPDAPIRVQVDELCHFCSHEETILVEHSPWARQRGKVIPFPSASD